MNTFDSMAKNYDTDEATRRAKETADEMRKHIVDGHAKSAIEYGCGTGLVGLQLANDFDTLLLVDTSDGMIEQLEQKLDSMDVPSVSVLHYDIMTDTSQDLHADCIFSCMVLHHLKDIEDVFGRFYHILQPGGHILIADLDKEDGSFHADFPNFDGHNGFEHAFLTEAAAKAGFVKTEIQTFYNGYKPTSGDPLPYSLFILDATK